jgi:hypothetical protein
MEEKPMVATVFRAGRKMDPTDLKLKLPREAVRMAELKHGDKLTVKVIGGKIIMEKVRKND